MNLGEIGRRVRESREARGLTQSSLAALVGVSRSAVAQWETGRSGQVGANLALVAEALGVGVSYLLLGEPGSPADRSEPPQITGNELALVRLYRRCGPADQAALVRLAHRFAVGQASPT